VGIVFKISILNYHEIASSQSESCPERRTFTSILFLQNCSNSIIGVSAQNLTGSISGSIIDNDQFPYPRALQNSGNTMIDRVLLVETGHNYA
jgi:hypothetical protein